MTTRTLLLILLFSFNKGAKAQDACTEVNFYFQQLSVNCRNIAGKLIKEVKEHKTTKVFPGMRYGQCSGTQAYTNDFVKFYAPGFAEPKDADPFYQHLRSELDTCLKADGYMIEAQADIDDGDKVIRWSKHIQKLDRTIVLEMKPDPDGGFIVTLEFILSQL